MPKKFRRDGVFIIYITHRMEEVFEISDRITVMRDGKYIETVDTADTTRRQLVKMMVGHELSEQHDKTSYVRTEEVLHIENVSLTFPPFYKKSDLKSISLTLRQGEVAKGYSSSSSMSSNVFSTSG